MLSTINVQGCSAEVGADVVQNDDSGQDAGQHASQGSEGGTWVALTDAAAHLGISVDTVKRRMKRGELESRRETIPQGFRWLVRIDSAESPQTEAVESPESDETAQRGVQVPVAAVDAVVALQRQLELREQEVSSLLATVATQARALEHAEVRLRQLEAAGSPESAETSDQDAAHQDAENIAPEGIWARLWRWWRG